MDELFKEMTKDFSFLKEENFPSWCKIKKNVKIVIIIAPNVQLDLLLIYMLMHMRPK